MSELAKKLIEENKRTKSQTLDLANSGLTEIPAEVAELGWLECLYLSAGWYDPTIGKWRRTHNVGPANQQFIGLQFLQKLVGLRRLALKAGEDISPLSGLTELQILDLSGGRITDITALSPLLALQTLDLTNTRVSDITPLVSLSSLRWLNLNRTQVSDVTALASLSTLHSLYLKSTQVSDITPLASLSSLQTVDLASTRVSDGTPIASLSALQTLDLCNTRVRDLSGLLDLIRGGLPVKWTSQWQGTGMYVENCPLTNPPPEIVQQGNDAVLNYFAERTKTGGDQLYEAKMLIIGDGGAGKTSLLRRLYQPNQPMPAEAESTKGISIHRHTFTLKNGRTFRLNVWDFGGQEIYHATHQFFLTHRSLYILLDDTRKDDKSVQDPCFRYWLGLVEVFGGGSPVLIFQNEKSGRSKSIDLDGIKGRYTTVKEKFQGDLGQAQAADPLRDAIEYFAAHLPHIGEELPAPWIKVRADIEDRAANEPYISQHEYFNIYKRHLEFDETKALFLSQYLHDLGVFLHFQKDILLKDTVILQNEWATQAVFKILDDESVKKNLGRFGEQDCTRIWKDSAYAAKHAELLALMKKFELCYELPDKSPREWLAPQLLPPAKPTDVKDWNQPNDLVLRYKYDFLPKGIISRLTVRMHRFVKRPTMAWVTGVLFERDSTGALVELLPDGQQIEIRARGPEAIGLLSAISSDLDGLNESFPGLKDKVKTLVPCSCEACSNAPTPYFFDQGDLIRRLYHNKRRAECGNSYQKMDVVQLLYKLPGWTKSETGDKITTLRIYLASSSELREDRDAFELYLRQRNDELRKQAIYLEIIRWENFLDAMSDTRLQDDYNKAVRSCDVFIALFFTKAGKFTDEEFNVAWGQFKASGKPRIYTYFRTPTVTATLDRKEDLLSLWAIQEKLKNLGHYQTNYDNTADLKLKFQNQLAQLIDSGINTKSRQAEA